MPAAMKMMKYQKVAAVADVYRIYGIIVPERGYCSIIMADRSLVEGMKLASWSFQTQYLLCGP
jgi:hypothetical protein